MLGNMQTKAVAESMSAFLRKSRVVALKINSKLTAVGVIEKPDGLGSFVFSELGGEEYGFSTTGLGLMSTVTCSLATSDRSWPG